MDPRKKANISSDGVHTVQVNTGSNQRRLPEVQPQGRADESREEESLSEVLDGAGGSRGH